MIQLVILALFGQQLVVGAALDDMAMLQYDDGVMLRTVESRCAMTNTVRPSIRPSTFFWISASVRVSMLDVASSRISTGGSATAARAMASSWRCPWLRFAPSLVTIVVVALRQTADEGVGIRNFGRPFNFRLCRVQLAEADTSATVPVNRWVSCKTTPSERRRSFFLMSRTSMPS